MHEAPANMEEKIKKLSERVRHISTPWYEKATPQRQEELLRLIAELEVRMMEYRAYRIPWDSKLVDTVESIEGVPVKVKTISTFDSVMDQARAIFCYINEKEQCNEC